MEGFIFLHRKLIEWEWYNDINTKVLFIHLLLRANHKDGKWRGQTIQKGQLITGRKALSQETGLSEQAVRTSLNKLKSTNEITIKTTNLNSLISINNWLDYQTINQQPNQRTTKKQPTNNQRTTTNNNEENDKNEKNEINYKNILLSEIKISDLPKNNQPHLEITKAFYHLFIANLQEYNTSTIKIEQTKGGCIDEIRLLIETDGKTQDELRLVWNFLKTDQFWKQNILSTKKLRQQFDKLLMQANKKTTKTNNADLEMEAYKRKQMEILNS